jgi:hypothetical protein
VLERDLDDGLVVARAAGDGEGLGEPEGLLPDGDLHGPELSEFRLPQTAAGRSR